MSAARLGALVSIVALGACAPPSTAASPSAPFGAAEPVDASPGSRVDAATPIADAGTNDSAVTAKNAAPAALLRCDAFHAIFLDKTEVPAGMQSTSEPCAHGDSFPPREGEKPITGHVRWVDPHGNEAVWRIDDERLVFPNDEAAARALDAESGRVNTLTLPTLEIAPAFVATRRGFGGTVTLPSGEPWTAYSFAARVGRVLVRVFVTQGPRAPAGALKRDVVEAIATRAAHRVELVPP